MVKIVVRCVLPLLLVFVTLFQFVSCTFLLGSALGAAGVGIVAAIKNGVDEETLDSVKDQVTSTSSKWFGVVVDNVDDWWAKATTSGLDLLEQADTKFHEIMGKVSDQGAQVLDNMVTSMARGIYNQAQKNFEGNIVPSVNVLSNVEGFSEVDSYYDYDVSSFAYKLIASMFPSSYDVFPAVLYNLDGESIVGLGYSDSSVKFEVTENGEVKNYYAAGFISADGEFLVTEDDLNAGLELHRADGYESDTDSFVLAYMPEPYTSHCIALGTYFVFGVNGLGQMEFTYTPNDDDCVYRHDLGELYSFDTNSIVAYKGTTSLFTESPFYGAMRYYSRGVDEIKMEIYDYFDGYKVDIDFSSLDIAEIFTSAKNMVAHAFSENQIVNDIKDLSINDLLGVEMFTPNMPESATAKEKYIVGTACILIAISSVTCAVLRQVNPAWSAVLGGVTGAAVEVFVQVCIENGSVKDLDYRKIAVASLSGALSASLGIVGDALVGGLTEGIYAALDGESFEEILKSIANGAITGLILGIVFHGLGKAIGFGAKKISAKLTKKAASAVSDAVAVVDGKAAKVVKGTTSDAAQQAARRATADAVDDATYSKAVSIFRKRAKNSLPSPTKKGFKYVDDAGNYVSKKVMNGWIEITDDAPIGLKASLKAADGTPITRLQIKNGSIDFSPVDHLDVKLSKFSVWRNTNFNNADKALANMWSESPNKVPAKYRNYFEGKGIELEDITQKHIANMRSELNLTWHETLDMQTMQLLPKAVHNVNKGGISHPGGISLAKLAKMYNLERNTLYAYVTLTAA